MVAEDDKMSKEKEIDKLMALISLSFKKIYKPTNNNIRTSSNTSRANQIILQGLKEALDEELEAHYLYMAQIQEVIPDVADNSGPIFNAKLLHKTKKTVLVAKGHSETTIEGYIENYKNIPQDIWDQLNAKDEAVKITLIEIDNGIFSTVDAFPNACEMWKAIERLKQCESINVQDLETNLYWEFRKFTSLDGESLESYYSRKDSKKNDVKARSMLLMAPPNEHLMTFDQYKDAKSLFAAIKTRFSSNEATKKTQKTLLKQMYENFSATSTEFVDSIFNRLQKLVSQLDVLSEFISQEDLNLKFLRSLPSDWNTHVVVWSNKPDLDIMSIDDLYNNFKIVEQEVKGTTSSNSSSQNMAFISSPSTNNTNEVYTAYGVSTVRTQSSTTSTQVGTASSQTSTANLSDATVYAFLANQSNGDQDSSRRTVNVEETPPKAMLLLMELVLTGALWQMMKSLQTWLLWLFQTLRMEFNKSEFNLPTYKRGLASVEEQLAFYKKNKEYPDASLVKDRVLDNKDCSVESPIVVEKKTDVPTIAKVEFVRPKLMNMTPREILMKTGRRPLNTARPKAVNTARPRVVNTARPNSAVVNAVKANQATCPISLTLRNLIEDMLPLEEEQMVAELLIEELLKLASLILRMCTLSRS
nr:hypothetical protein [Tanacetum cinerariifolium]